MPPPRSPHPKSLQPSISLPMPSTLATINHQSFFVNQSCLQFLSTNSARLPSEAVVKANEFPKLVSIPKRSPASPASLNELQDQLKAPTYLQCWSIRARSEWSQKWDNRPLNQQHQHLTGKLTARKSVLMIRPCCRSLVQGSSSRHPIQKIFSISSIIEWGTGPTENSDLSIMLKYRGAE